MTPNFFTKEVAQRYDERNSRLNRISEAMHFLIGLVLKNLPEKSKVLCVGAGTGAEIIFMAEAFPQWSFVALEPSLDMLNICRERVQALGYAERCEFFHGYINDYEPGEFDAVLSVLVAHFIKKEDRQAFFNNMTSRLRTGGCLINVELSYDLDSPDFAQMLKGWEEVQRLMGATPESIAALPALLRNTLHILQPSATESFMRASGIAMPVRFFQALMMCGWYGTK